MKNTTLLFSVLVCMQTLFAQTVKNYAGPFEIENISDQNAIAKYSYTEDAATFQRLKTGPFSLVFKGTGNYAFLNSVTVNGLYKNNLKAGKWILKLTYKNLSGGGQYISGVETVTCNYINGELDGAFVYTSTLTSCNRTYDYKTRQYVFGKPSLPQVKKLTANFTKGVVTGNYNYSFTDQARNSLFTVTATLDSNSYLNNKYIESGDGNEKIVEYKNGFWIRIINKNLQTGNVEIRKNEKFAFQDSVFTAYLSEKASKPELEETVFKIEGFNGNGDAGYDRLYDVINKNSDLFIFMNIGGDSTLDRIKKEGLWAFMNRSTK